MANAYIGESWKIRNDLYEIYSIAFIVKYGTLQMDRGYLTLISYLVVFPAY